MAVRTVFVGFYLMILWRFYRSINNVMGGGRGGNQSDSPGKLATSNLPTASFDDIQAMEDAKLKVMEFVKTLRAPDAYAIFGARSPTGLLLEGPPGVGKTLLARATATTAGVPLLYCSGSDFVEMYVGRGAVRVRSVFERAQKLAPCIVSFG